MERMARRAITSWSTKALELISPAIPVVEGIQTVREVMMVAQRINIDMPICEQVYAVIYGGVEPLVAVQTLLARAQKPESYD